MKTKLINRSSLFLLLLLGILPLAELFRQTFELKLDPLWPLWLIALCLLMGFASVSRRWPALFIALSLLTVSAAFLLYADEPGKELLDLLGQIRNVYLDHFNIREAPEPGGKYDHTALFLALMYLLTAFVALALGAGNYRINLTLLATIPFAAACLSVNGSPEQPTIFCLLLFYALLLVGGQGYDEEGGRGAILLQSAVPCFLILLLSLALADPSGYNYTEEDVVLSRRIDQLGNAISAFLSPRFAQPEETEKPAPETTPSPTPAPRVGSGNWSISRSELDMRAGRYGVDERAVILRVSAEKDGYLYLRRCSFGDYGGSTWALPETSELPSSLPYAARALEQSGAPLLSLSVDLVVSSDLEPVPYFCLLEDGGDAYVLSNGEKHFELSYYDAGASVYALRLAPEDPAEAAYRAYAHETYTRLPESTAFSAAEILREQGISADDPDCIRKVAAFVQQSAVYDINTPSYAGYDLAVYFLTQSHRGYCLHFATAAVVLYRSLGIPARLTDGFLVYAKAGKTVDVLQKDEHAWAEVYIDGLGWVPVEATGGGYGFAGTGSGSGSGTGVGTGSESGQFGEAEEPEEDHGPSPFAPDALPAATPRPTPSPTPTPAPPTPSPAPDQTPAPDDEPEESQDLPGGLSDLGRRTKKSDRSEKETVSPLLSAAAAVLILLLTLCLLRTVILILRRKAIRQKDARRAAVAIWKEAVAMLKGQERIPAPVRACAERAAFGRRPPSREELKEARLALKEAEQTRFAESGWLKKLLLLLRGRLF